MLSFVGFPLGGLTAMVLSGPVDTTLAAISGLAVGAAQSLVLVRRTGPLAFLWPAYLAAAWSIGWAVTTAVGVQVEEQFTVFGAAGAVTVTMLTAVLPAPLPTRFLTEMSS